MMNCKFNFGVDCDQQKCAECGWNPKVYEARTGNKAKSHATVWKRMDELYNANCSDKEIANALCCGSLTVKLWRERFGYAEHIKDGRSRNKNG